MLKNIQTSTHVHVIVVDLLPYDGTLPLACSTGLKVAPEEPEVTGVSGVARKKRRIEDDFPVSSVGCISVLWAGGDQHIETTKTFVKARIAQNLLMHLRTSTSALPAAANVPVIRSFDSFNSGVAPVLDESKFKHTKPLSDKSLPILQSVYDEFEEYDADVKNEFNIIVTQHNEIYNKSGKPYNNRKKDSNDDGQDISMDSDAVNLAGQAGIPQTKAHAFTQKIQLLSMSADSVVFIMQLYCPAD